MADTIEKVAKRFRKYSTPEIRTLLRRHRESLEITNTPPYFGDRAAANEVFSDCIRAMERILAERAEGKGV